MLNHSVIMGRLTKDVELRYTPSNVAVASFRLAVDRDRKNKNGDKETDYIDCVAWNNTAEFVSKHFSKGSMAIVTGRLQIREWTDKDGGKRTTPEIYADNVYFGETKRQAVDRKLDELEAKPGVTFTDIEADDETLPF